MKYYFVVTSPTKKNYIIEAIDKFHAIAKAVEIDKHKWSNNMYKAEKTKL